MMLKLESKVLPKFELRNKTDLNVIDGGGGYQ